MCDEGQGVTVRVADLVPLRLPVIVTVRVVVTVRLDTLNVATVAPGGTVTLDGTVATAVLLLDRPTDIPPEGAGPFNATVPVEILPPLTLVGFSVKDERDGAVTVRD